MIRSEKLGVEPMVRLMAFQDFAMSIKTIALVNATVAAPLIASRFMLPVPYFYSTNLSVAVALP